MIALQYWNTTMRSYTSFSEFTAIINTKYRNGES